MPQAKPLREGQSSRRVHVTLTSGQDQAIRKSTLYALCGRRLAAVIAHWVTEGIMRDVDRVGKR